MLLDLRLSAGLTRAELAQRIGRSINYIVKAEQLTFPTLPPAFAEYYRNEVPKDVLEDAYRDAQRRTREQFLRDYRPLAQRTSFRKRWAYRESGKEDDEGYLHPTEYALSKGLCIPAATVYRSEKDGTINQPIKAALSDLVDYALSGRFQADMGLDDEIYEEITTLVRLKQEMGA